MASRFFAWYSRQLETAPLLTKAVSSGLIAGAGDVLCQTLIDEKQQQHDKESDTVDNPHPLVQGMQQWDAARTGRFVLLGATLVAPAIHYWYAYLSRILPGSSLNSVAKRVALDQFAFTPFFLSGWLAAFWSLEGSHPIKDVPSRIPQVVPSILVANWVFWIPAVTVNFRFVPLKFQVLFSNVLALVWNSYLSYKTSSSSPQDEKEENEDLPMEYPVV